MKEESISSLLIIQNAILASRLSKKVSGQLSVHGISLTEYIVMHYLSSGVAKEVSRIALADHLGMSASGITRLLLPMEKNNTVERVSHPRDSRQSLVRLTNTGQQLFADASVSFSFIAKDLTSNLSQSQQEKLIEYYKKVL